MVVPDAPHFAGLLAHMDRSPGQAGVTLNTFGIEWPALKLLTESMPAPVDILPFGRTLQPSSGLNQSPFHDMRSEKKTEISLS